MPSPQHTARQLARSIDLRPTLALVLGSGFQPIARRLQITGSIPYAKLPGFPRPTVPGHAGRLLAGHLDQTPVLILNGRTHYYEGHDMDTVTFAVRTLAAFGIRDLLLTNAAGGINRRFRPGDLMLLTDHINLMGANPLRGPAPSGLPRFVDLTTAYDPDLGALLRKAARQVRTRLRTGVYLAVSGPSYETPAEIRAFERLGADAVGMSTVPETIAARQCGLRVAALSCITNLAAGRAPFLCHTDVLETADRVKTTASALVAAFAQLYATSSISK